MRYIFSVVLIAVLSVFLACQSGSTPDAETGTFARILNGDSIDESSIPQLVKIHIDTSSGRSLCTGIVADATHIITAAHCLDDVVSTPVVEGYNIETPVLNSWVHPLYRYDSSLGVIFHDLAVLETTAHGLPALPIFSTGIHSGEVFQVLGYGIDDNGQWGRLISGSMTVDTVSSNHLFALPFQEGSESGSCNGDSGGPSIFQRSYHGANAYGITGIVSTGSLEFCGAGDVTAFTNLQQSENVSFLQQRIPGLTVLHLSH